MAPEPNQHVPRYLDLLHSILDIAHDIARQIHQQAITPAPPDTPKPDCTIPIERVARTIRRTILLALKVAEPPKPDPKPGRIAARKRIIREVEDHINRNTDDEDETASLQADLLDRLDSPDLEDELDDRPIPEIITDIVRDLGLDGNWGPNRFKRRTIEDIEALQARAAQPLPTTPRPPRTRPPRPRPKRPHLDESLTPAQTIAAILGMPRPDG